MKKLLIGLIALILLTGCSGSSEFKEIKTSDLCVTHINLDAEICYGDDRKKVEPITGEGEKVLSYMRYENGLSIMYRNDKVAGLALYEESQNFYETDFAQIGESKASIIERLGADNGLSQASQYLDYFFDTNEKKFIVDTSKFNNNLEEMEKVIIVSFMFDDDENASRVMLIDRRMAVYLE